MFDKKYFYILLLLNNMNILNNIKGFQLKSKTLSKNKPINKEYTCLGENINPDFYWINPPENTKSYGLILEDFDAKNPHPFVHWIIFNMDKNVKSIEINNRKYDNGFNSYNVDYYKGPCPPINELHHYKFTLFALSKEHFDKNIGINRETFLNAIKNYIIDKASLTVIFSRTI